MGFRGSKQWPFLRRTISLSVVVSFAIGLVVAPPTLVAQDLMGADGALKQITDSLEQHAADGVDQDTDSAAETVTALLNQFRKGRAELSAEQAASQWLQIYDAWGDPSGDQNDEFVYSSGARGFTLLVGDLPKPDHWAELSKQIVARQMPTERIAKVREHALRMLGYRLTGQAEKLKAEITATRKLLTDADDDENAKPAGGGVLGMIGQAFNFGDETDDWQIRSLAMALSGLSTKYAPETRLAAFTKSLENVSPETGYFVVPDLVKMAGDQRASELLRKTLMLEGVSLYFEDSEKTKALARTVASDMLGEIRHPHWQLCDSLDCIEMYEAFAKLSVAAEQNDYEAYTAGTWYVSALIIAGRGDDVVTFIEQQVAAGEQNSGMSLVDSLESQLINLLQEPRHSDAVYQFLVDALQRSPGLPLWKTFAAVAARKGKIDQMLEIVESQLESEGLTSSARQRMQKIRGDTLLAADRPEDAVEQYRSLFDPQSSGETTAAASADLRFEIAVRIAEVGRLLERPEWIQTGVKTAKQLLSDDAKAELEASELVTVLVRLHRFAEAERLLASRISLQLARDAVSQQNDSFYTYQGFGGSNTVPGMLASLARVYHAADRHADVLSLLGDAPWWNNKDLSDLVSNASLYSAFSVRTDQSVPIGYIAAKALSEVGRVSEARAICESILSRQSGHDPTWALQLRLSDDFESFANKIFAQDRFEERPLIWLARFQLDHGNIGKADELIRRAIKIDPSDGEQGRLNRMRAYKILAEVLAAQGDTEKSEIYRGAVRAIRMAEDGDQFYQAGLLKRGIKKYQTSLTHFEDAYCIQSRLAVQFAGVGAFESAAKHYQKAFELMPGSFGRVESHCFGCEGVFTGKLAGDIAERVFKKLIADSPENPQVQYLMGYLNADRERYEIAAGYFQTAVRLDPDYLNAWKKILETDQAGNLTSEQRDQAVFNLIRLDPLGRHEKPDITEVKDLKRLWTVLASRPAEPELGELLPLTGSIKELGSQPGSDDRAIMYEYEAAMESANGFASHGELAAIASLIDLASQN